MAGRGLEYWEKRWADHASFCGPGDQGVAEVIAYLFREYTSFQPLLPGAMSRFFSGRWNTHHANEVTSAIGLHIASPEKYSKTPYEMLSAIKREMGVKKVSPEGDFAQIMAVISRNACLCYEELELSLLDKMKVVAKVARDNNCTDSDAAKIILHTLSTQEPDGVLIQSKLAKPKAEMSYIGLYTTLQSLVEEINAKVGEVAVLSELVSKREQVAAFVYG